MKPGEPTQVRARPAPEPSPPSSAAEAPGRPAGLSAQPHLLRVVPRRRVRASRGRASRAPSVRLGSGRPETAEPAAPGEGVSGGRSVEPLPVPLAAPPHAARPGRGSRGTRSPTPVTRPAPCSPGFCSSGRPVATAARPRGACGCSCGRWCGAGPAETGAGRRSDCCMPGRGPTQVTPGRPRRPCGLCGAPAVLCTPLPPASLGKERRAGSQDIDILVSISRLTAVYREARRLYSLGLIL